MVYGPDFGYYQMELLPTQPCADLRALLFSEFVSFFYLLAYLLYLILFVSAYVGDAFPSWTDTHQWDDLVTYRLHWLAAPSVSNKESTRRVNHVYSGGGLLFVLYPYFGGCRECEYVPDNLVCAACVI